MRGRCSAVVATVVAVVALAALAAACDTDDAVRRADLGVRPTTTSTTLPTPVSAAALLATVAVKDVAPAPGYARAAFGPAWADMNRNGCDTRNDILNRDLVNKVWRVRTHGCVVILGDLHDPYTGARLHFEKQQADHVQIDHVVALADAWRTGAAAWTDARRLQFANDPLELLAVEGRVNQAKGDSDASEWLPPAEAARCEYARRQLAIKAKWALWMTAAEHAAIADVLSRCR
jgi:hypothetical protein